MSQPYLCRRIEAELGARDGSEKENRSVHEPGARHRSGPIEPVLARLDPLLASPISLTNAEVSQPIAFVQYGLLDPRAKPDHLRKLIPPTVPSGRPLLSFEFP